MLWEENWQLVMSLSIGRSQFSSAHIIVGVIKKVTDNYVIVDVSSFNFSGRQDKDREDLKSWRDAKTGEDREYLSNKYKREDFKRTRKERVIFRTEDNMIVLYRSNEHGLHLAKLRGHLVEE